MIRHIRARSTKQHPKRPKIAGLQPMNASKEQKDQSHVYIPPSQSNLRFVNRAKLAPKALPNSPERMYTPKIKKSVSQ